MKIKYSGNLESKKPVELYYLCNISELDTKVKRADFPVYTCAHLRNVLWELEYKLQIENHQDRGLAFCKLCRKIYEREFLCD